MFRLYETKRLRLKTLDINEAHKSLDFYKRNQMFLSEFEPQYHPSFYTLDQHTVNLSAEQEAMDQLKTIRLWLFKKNDITYSKPIGTLCFSNIIRGYFQSCFVGYKMDKNNLRKGYMSEALEEGIRVMFDEYNLHRIEANIMPRNKPSLALANKLGFQEEGLAKSYLYINGKWEDHIHMVILNNNLELN